MNKYIKKLKTIKEKQDGFSLIELVVAVGILAILSVVGVVAYSKITENARKTAVEAAAADVYTGALAYDSDGKNIEDAAEEWKNSAGNDSITVSATKPNGKDICVVAKNNKHPEANASKGAGCDGSTENGDEDNGNNPDGETGVITRPATAAECFKFAAGTITDYTVECGGTDVVIPNTINGQAVETIGNLAFYDMGLTSVEFNEGLGTIGDAAFHGNSLTSVDFPSSLKSIGNEAFYSNEITSVEIPSSVKTIGDYAFDTNVDIIVLGDNDGANPAPAPIEEEYTLDIEVEVYAPEYAGEYVDFSHIGTNTFRNSKGEINGVRLDSEGRGVVKATLYSDNLLMEENYPIDITFTVETDRMERIGSKKFEATVGELTKTGDRSYEVRFTLN